MNVSLVNAWGGPETDRRIFVLVSSSSPVPAHPIIPPAFLIFAFIYSFSYCHHVHLLSPRLHVPWEGLSGGDVTPPLILRHLSSSSIPHPPCPWHTSDAGLLVVGSASPIRTDATGRKTPMDRRCICVVRRPRGIRDA
eukprot:5169118-Pyramimonas_sp.AAC.1